MTLGKKGSFCAAGENFGNRGLGGGVREWSGGELGGSHFGISKSDDSPPSGRGVWGVVIWGLAGRWGVVSPPLRKPVRTPLAKSREHFEGIDSL